MNKLQELQLQFQLEMSTGLPKEKLQVLKIKANADHVGPSLQLLLLNQASLLLVEMTSCLNNNLLIALDLMEIKDVMEDGWIQLSNM